MTPLLWRFIEKMSGVDEEAHLLSSTPAMASDAPKAVDLREVSIKDLAKARNAFFVWTFFGYIAFGVMTELYSNLFYEVIDKNNYSKASFYSTLAMTLYSVTSFFLSPIVSTLSDSIGRKPVFLISAIVDSVTGMLAGLVPNNWVFISMMMLQGAGDNSMATGYSLLADYVVSTPKGHSGSEKDGWFTRTFYRIIRLGSGHDEERYMERELGLQYTVILIIQTCGLLIGVVLGDLLYMATSSYPLSVAFSGFIYCPNILYIYCYMPETVPPSRRKPISARAFCQAMLTQWDSIFLFIGNHRLWALAIVNFLVQFISAGVFDVVLYWGEWKFGWGTDMEAVALYVSIFSGIIGAVVLPRLLLNQGVSYAHMIGLMCLVSSIGCIPSGFSSNNVQIMCSLLVVGVGFGAIPGISSQIANEASAEEQGRVNGFNYAISTLAWASGPYAYWYMFIAYVDDDAYDADDKSVTHLHNTAASLMWWVTSGLFFLAGLIMFLFVKESDGAKLLHSG